jgi:hypothetical protein
MNDRDAKLLMENYQLVREEQESDPKAVAQKLASSDEIVKATEQSAQQLFQKYQKEIEQAKQDGTIDQLLQKIEAELSGGAEAQPAQPVGESYLEEGLFDRLKSRASGAYSALTGAKPGDQSGEATDYQSAKINKRFAILQNTIGKDLRELERDLETTSNTDNTVKDQIKQMITSLGTGGDNVAAIKPETSKLGDIRHAIGRGVQSVGTSALIGLPVIAAVGSAGAALGLGAVGIGVAKGVVAGATVSALKDLINGQKPSGKRAILAAAVGGIAGGIMGHYSGGHAPSHPTGPEHAPQQPHFRVNPDLAPQPHDVAHHATPSGDEFKQLHGGPENLHSHIDVAKDHLAKVLDSKGIMGTSHGSTVASPHIMNAIPNNATTADYSKLADWVNKLDPAHLKILQHSKPEAIAAAVKHVIGK